MAGALSGANYLWPAPPLNANLTFSHEVLAADGSLLRLSLAMDDHYRLWQGLDGMAASLPEAVLLKEDRWFAWHPGVNPVALLRATVKSLGGERQGASTISMQLARRLYRLHTRSFSGKLKQMALGVWLDLRYSKAAILEAYLNLIPMGGNIEGVAAAARIYFHKDAADLSPSEALALAVLPQRPKARQAFGPNLQAARQALAREWLKHHPEDDLSVLNTLDIGARALSQLPFRAPHLALHLLAREPGDARIQTFIEPHLQSLLERQMRRYLNERRGEGLNNASALLIDHRDQRVLAWVGSADYYDDSILGQVDGVRAKRSTGSTLKPFLYGLGFDQGLIHPATVLKDAPQAFGPFRPENFDGRFLGPVSAEDALIRSRNLPAVWLASQVQSPSLHGLLRAAGVADLASEQHYGLALALGGGELSPLELATLYSMLPNRGRWSPVRLSTRDPEHSGVPVLSPEAAWVVLDMLKKTPRPDGQSGPTRPDWATVWKTGTSWGFRDAWAAGVTGPYVLVVWLGNFAGQGNPALIGVSAATPLFLRIADRLAALPGHGDSRWPGPPATLRKVAVCAASGELPNAWCPRLRDTWYWPGRSPARVSNLHRPVVIDLRTGRKACAPFDPGMTELRVFEFWPSDLARLFALAGLPRRAPPTPDPRCTHTTADAHARDGLRVSSPLADVTYTLRLSHPEESIALRAVAAAGVGKTYWFANTSFVGQSAPERDLPWRPKTPGQFQISVVDERGLSDVRQVRVELVP